MMRNFFRNSFCAAALILLPLSVALAQSELPPQGDVAGTQPASQPDQMIQPDNPENQGAPGDVIVPDTNDDQVGMQDDDDAPLGDDDSGEENTED